MIYTKCSQYSIAIVSRDPFLLFLSSLPFYVLCSPFHFPHFFFSCFLFSFLLASVHQFFSSFIKPSFFLLHNSTFYHANHHKANFHMDVVFFLDTILFMNLPISAPLPHSYKYYGFIVSPYFTKHEKILSSISSLLF